MRILFTAVALLSATQLTFAMEKESSNSESGRFSIRMDRAKASLYKIENGEDYLFVVHASVNFCHQVGNVASPYTFHGLPLGGKEARIFKGPIDNMCELSCSTSSSSLNNFDIRTNTGTLSIDKQQWIDPYENEFKLVHLKKMDNKDLFAQIVLKDKKQETSTAEKLDKAGLPQTTNLAPKSRLYQVDGQKNYFFVGFNKIKYYGNGTEIYFDVDSFLMPKNKGYQLCEGYKVRIFYGEYPQLNEVITADSHFPGPSSSVGPYCLLGLDNNSLKTTLNPMTGYWTKGNGAAYKLIHVKKEENEEFFKKIKFNQNS